MIVVSDMYQSVSVLVWDPQTKHITLLARHYSNLEPSACLIYMHNTNCSFMIADTTGNIQLLRYLPNKSSSVKYLRLSARSDYYLGSPVYATGIAAAPTVTWINDARRTHMVAMLSTLPGAMDSIPGGIAGHGTVPGALLAHRQTPQALSQPLVVNAKTAPALHSLRTTALCVTRAGSLVAVTPVDSLTHAKLLQLSQQLAYMHPHVAAQNPFEYRQFRATGGWTNEGALTGRQEIGKGDVLDLDLLSAYLHLPYAEQKLMATEAGTTPAHLVDSILTCLVMTNMF
jgi:hypothetical protein